MDWKNININKQNIEAETKKSMLIKMPNNSHYDGFMFWHPSKLIRKGRHSNAVSLSYTDEFTFKLKKYGKGKHNKSKVIDEIEIGADEFEDAFEVTDKNIVSKQFVNEYETHIPRQLKAIEAEVREELKDD